MSNFLQKLTSSLPERQARAKVDVQYSDIVDWIPGCSVGIRIGTLNFFVFRIVDLPDFLGI